MQPMLLSGRSVTDTIKIAVKSSTMLTAQHSGPQLPERKCEICCFLMEFDFSDEPDRDLS